MEIHEERIRITYSKLAPMRFTSILDVQTIWERTFRRSGVILSYSKGFHPQAKIQQASPLPLGFCGEQEIIDVWIDAANEQSLTKETINPFLPNGMQIQQVETVDLHAPTLQQNVVFSDYSACFLQPVSEKELVSLVEKIQRSKNIQYTRHNGKQYDLKPLIRSAHVHKDTVQGATLLLSLSTSPSATGRPDHLLHYFHYDPSLILITRKMIHFLHEQICNSSVH